MTSEKRVNRAAEDLMLTAEPEVCSRQGCGRPITEWQFRFYRYCPQCLLELLDESVTESYPVRWEDREP